MTLEVVAEAIEALDIPTRMRVIPLADGTCIVDDTYNAQPASMLAALDMLDEMPGRHLALLGDMLELGSAARYEHERVGERAGEVLDALVTLGPQARHMGEVAQDTGHGEVHHASSREEATALATDLAEAFAGATALLQALVRPGDAVLIKGSHALGLEAVVAAFEDESRRGAADGGTT